MENLNDTEAIIRAPQNSELQLESLSYDPLERPIESCSFVVHNNLHQPMTGTPSFISSHLYNSFYVLMRLTGAENRSSICFSYFQKVQPRSL